MAKLTDLPTELTELIANALLDLKEFEIHAETHDRIIKTLDRRIFLKDSQPDRVVRAPIAALFLPGIVRRSVSKNRIPMARRPVLRKRCLDEQAQLYQRFGYLKFYSIGWFDQYLFQRSCCRLLAQLSCK